MKAIKFEGHNVVMGKDQPEYEDLPAYVQENGIVTTCFRLDDSEIREIEKSRLLRISLMNMGRPCQPTAITANRPKFPIDFKSRWMVNPHSWGKTHATFNVPVTPGALMMLQKEKKIWISTVTYGAAMQPISGNLKHS